MSAWMIAVRRLAQRSEPVTTMQLGVTSDAICRAKELGMAERVGPSRKTATWRITDLGRRFAAGEVLFCSTERTRIAVQRAVSDDEIARLLMEAGHVQGAPITADVMRAYSAALLRRAAGR